MPGTGWVPCSLVRTSVSRRGPGSSRSWRRRADLPVADGHDVADGQRPQPAPVVGAGQLRPGGVPRVVVEDRERLLGDLLGRPPGLAW